MIFLIFFSLMRFAHIIQSEDKDTVGKKKKKTDKQATHWHGWENK